MSRMAFRILLAGTVVPFIFFGWLLSVWLSEHTVHAAEQDTAAGKADKIVFELVY